MSPSAGRLSPSALSLGRRGRAHRGAAGADEFLITGRKVHIDFTPKAEVGRHRQFARVEEGEFVDGRWVLHHVWNGDQTDYGLFLTGVPRILKVKLATY